MSEIAFEELISSSSNQYTFTALLIHGLLGSRDSLMDFARSLASSLSTSSEWRMILVDLRNHGSSVDREGLSPPHDIPNAARDLANLFISLNGDWPDVVIGHSLGGKVALQYVLSCAQGDYGDSAKLPKQLWVLDAIPGKIENKSHYEELGKILHSLQTLPSPIPSQEWLVDHMVGQGFSKFLSEYISSHLKKSGEHLTFSFNVEGVIQMFKSSRVTDYWVLLEQPPKGTEIAIVRTESRLTWDPDVVERLESLAKRESDGSSGKVSVDVVPRAGHWIHKDEPQRLLEIMLWVLDVIPGKMENKSQNEELVKALRTLQTLPSPIPSQEWLVDHMVNLGFSEFLSGYISSSLKKSGEHETFLFDIEGAILMFKSARDTDYWPLLEQPPKGMEIAIVRTESQLMWDMNVVARLESLAKRESDGSSGIVSVHVVPRSGHWIYKDEPHRLLEIMAPRMASMVQPNL
ncbi:hypothetical protein OSB04_020878 [Centaurea solstitialis]|uniref:AB hydrolase-1 domain-containing protein n=1 Tax=Centaurea solstitialis TaxID=347529 RepID=A0AA38T583_9ASTR|nr:hypothetical protein OSB04_020878 [Centaurea solstitialis]